MDEFPVLNDREESFTKGLLEIFEKQDNEGEFIFKDESVRQILPGLLLGSGLVPSEFEYGPIKGLFAEFREKLKLPAEVSDDDYLVATRRYYRKYPPDKKLLASVQEYLR